jgi:hypothetical protein
MDRSAVIIGPTEPYPPSQEECGSGQRIQKSTPRSIHGIEQWEAGEEKRVYSKGIASGTQVTWMAVSNMTFQYSDVGVHMYPAGEVLNCTFQHLHDTGIVGDKAYVLVVEDCEFQDTDIGIGVQAYGGGQQWVRIGNCHGDAVYSLIYNGGHPDLMVEDCSALGGMLDLWGGHAVIRRCNAIQGSLGISIGLNGYAEIHDCELAPSSGFALYVTGSNVIGDGNVLRGSGVYPTCRFGNCTIELHNSHILHAGDQYSVQVGYHNGPSDAIDLRNNYWGTTSADTIAAWIWDGHDDPSVQTYVQYEPFSSVPIPTRKKSWGGVKALFR